MSTDPTDALKLHNGGGIQFNDVRNSSIGWIAASSSTGTVRKDKTVINENLAATAMDSWENDDNVVPKPFNYFLSDPSSELNGAAIKEKLMMSSSHIPESCV